MKSFYQIITTKRCNGVRKDAFITELPVSFHPISSIFTGEQKKCQKRSATPGGGLL